MKRAALAILFLLWPLAAMAAERPSFGVAEGFVTMSLSPGVLRDSGVRKRLGSGLTTTFLVTIDRPDAEPAQARIEVRYELWDEVYIVRRIDARRKAEVQRLASLELLERWWSGPLRMFPAGGTRERVEIAVSVLPFSAAEEEDARQWLSKSAGVGGPTPSRTASGGLVDVLMGTSIAAKPITTFRWTADL
jgi:hypothetical protein